MMMRIAMLFLAMLTTGCSPLIDARLRLIDVSRGGLAKVGQSIIERQQSIAALQTAERRRLDAAFDADVRRQWPLTDAWVIEARTAYAAAIDQFAARERRSEAAAEIDRANLAAVDAALRQIEALDRSQLQLQSLIGGTK